MAISAKVAGALLALSLVPGAARFLLARLSRMKVRRLAFGFGPVLYRRSIIQVCAVPIGLFTQIVGLDPVDVPVAANDPQSFGARPWTARLAVLLAGVLGLYFFAAALITTREALVGRPEAGPPTVVSRVRPGSPAERAGLQPGDDIVAVDGFLQRDGTELSRQLQQGTGNATLEIDRAGERQRVAVTAVEEGGVRRIGIELMQRTRNAPTRLWRAALDGIRYPFEYTRSVLGAPFETIGVVQVANVHARRGFGQLLWVEAATAVFLMLYLLLPLPALDGGRTLLFFLVRRRARGEARDLGELQPERSPVGAAAVAALALFGVAAAGPFVASDAVAVAKGGTGFTGLGALFLICFVSLLARAPWAWYFGLNLAFGAFAALGVQALASQRQEGAPAIVVLVFAVGAAVSGALLAIPSVRACFRLRCPACRAVRARSVSGADRAFSCLACGSTWRGARTIVS